MLRRSAQKNRAANLASVVLGCVALVAALSGCGGQETATEETVEVETTEVESASTCAPINVVTGFYPLQFVADRVGSDQTTVSVLAGPGVEAHDLELTPSQAAEVTDADVVVYLPTFMPSVDEAVAELNASAGLDVMAGLTLLEGEADDHDHGDSHDDEGKEDGEMIVDPHVWLDPTNVSAIASTLANKLGELDPACSVIYTDNASALTDEMTALDSEMTAALANCEVKSMVVSHEAFGYLANRYGFEQVGISGLTPEAEPSPNRLAEVAEVSKSDGVTTVYYETLVSPVVAETLATELDIEAAKLDPIESKPEGGDLVSQMRANLETLVKGQNCA
jgi:zinc transport system substrate-binding protein